MRLYLIMILTVLSSIVYASSISDEQAITKLNEASLSKAENYQSYALDMNHQRPKNKDSIDDYAKKLGNDGLSRLNQYYQTKAAYLNNQNKEKPYHGFIVFASLGMPSASLKALIKEANTYHAPIIIQGLYRNSLTETAKKIFQLTKVSKKGGGFQGGIMIDPTWFEFYHIKKVPAFVITEDIAPCQQDKTCKIKTYDILYGNISLTDALRIFDKKGSKELKPIVESFIKKGNKHV